MNLDNFNSEIDQSFNSPRNLQWFLKSKYYCILEEMFCYPKASILMIFMLEFIDSWFGFVQKAWFFRSLVVELWELSVWIKCIETIEIKWNWWLWNLGFFVVFGYNLEEMMKEEKSWVGMIFKWNDILSSLK